MRASWALLGAALAALLPFAGVATAEDVTSSTFDGKASDSRAPRLELKLELPDRPPGTTFLEEASVPPDGPVTYRYRGVAAVAVHHALGGFRRFLGQETPRLDLESPFDRDRHDFAVGCYAADQAAGGCWWERGWRACQPTERGGLPASPSVVDVGRDFDVVDVGCFNLTSDGRIRLDGFAVRIQDLRANGARRVGDILQPRTPVEVQPVVLEFSGRSSHEADTPYAVEEVPELAGRVYAPKPTPPGSLWTGDGWSLDARPGVRFKLPAAGDPCGVVASADLDLRLRFFAGKARKPVLVVGADLKLEPSGTGPPLLSASFDLQFLVW